MRPTTPEALTDVAGTVYGVHLRGSLPTEFSRYLRAAGTGPREGQLSLDVSFRSVRELPAATPIWATEPASRTVGRVALSRLTDGFGLTVDSDGSGMFRVTEEAIAIDWLSGSGGAARCFFSYALPLWLEARGVPMLHASAVSFAGRAVAFVGPSGIGKSTLCAGLLRAGCGFVADDGLPLHEDSRGDWRCAPGPPWLRLWPSALERRLGLAAAELPRVQPSLDKRLLPCSEVTEDGMPARPPLAVVYVLEGPAAGARQVGTTACTARDALVHLIEHSLAGGPVTALGWAPERLRRLARLAERTPVKRLRYPAGDVPWCVVYRAIAEELRAAGEASVPR